MTAMNILPSKLVAGAAQHLMSSGAGPGGYENYGLAMRFAVKIKGKVDLGRWSSCGGLSVTFKPDTAPKEGGAYDSPLYFPGEVEYGDVTLERAMEATDSNKVREWLGTVVTRWINWDGSGPVYQGEPVVITLYDSRGGTTAVAEWELSNAIPKSWSGPTLSGKSNEVAIERLVLMHQGFLKSGGQK
jgi:phage tail-like protein